MQRKKLIRRAAWIGALGVAACLVAIVVVAIVYRSGWDEQRANLETHIAALTKEYQGFLDETASKLKGLPADPKVIGDIQTRHYRESPGRWLYLWASTNDGDFSFGVPSDAFARLNTVYDQNQAVIAKDNHYASRDQFLRTLLHHSRPLGPPVLKDKDEDGRYVRGHDEDWWRFHDENEGSDWSSRRTNLFFLSSPIQDARGATVGNLNLKLVDAKDANLYSGLRGSPWEQAFETVGPFLAIFLIWLWFLVPSWVYVDALERDVPRPMLWAFFTLIGGVFALMVYLITRPTEVREFHCPQCGKVLNGSKAGCPYCGADLSAVFCRQCQYPVKPDWSYCPSCRVSLGRKEPAASPGPA